MLCIVVMLYIFLYIHNLFSKLHHLLQYICKCHIQDTRCHMPDATCLLHLHSLPLFLVFVFTSRNPYYKQTKTNPNPTNQQNQIKTQQIRSKQIKSKLKNEKSVRAGYNLYNRPPKAKNKRKTTQIKNIRNVSHIRKCQK
ncbi:hypothetical protein BZA77DRAFT_134491 [Pyronema omphalodes]|nr:hypothetical protein BZA77DRAFT_134491 [Pyronema omphalodes]